MTDLLTRLRNTTVASLEGVRSDFDDDKPYVFRPGTPKGMTRIVEGADDLKVSRPAPKNPGMVKVRDWSGDSAGVAHNGERCNNTTCCPADERGLPTERQRNFINSLMLDLLDLDQELYAKAVEYNVRMTENRAWDAKRDGNVSRWINNLKAKIAELRAAEKVAPAPVKSDWTDIPTGYYALVEDAEADIIKFYRVKHGKDQWAGRVFIDACASDDRHPIRNAVHKKNILTAIREMGVAESTALYGQKIGNCGRCGRTLTDAESRAYGIGPECRKKM
jgi:hypothetical protein